MNIWPKSQMNSGKLECIENAVSIGRNIVAATIFSAFTSSSEVLVKECGYEKK